MNEEMMKTITLMQQHQAHLLFALIELPEVKKAVAEGRMGNSVSHETKIRLHKEAIQQLAATL